MTRYRRTFIVASVLLIAGIIPLVASGLVSLLIHWKWNYPLLNSVVEALGGFAAFCLAALLLLLRRYKKDEHHLLWIATGLIGMGILNGLKACAPAGVSSVWLHSTAVFAGGLIFALVWLPAPYSKSPFARALPQRVAVAALLFGLFSLAYPSLLPPMASDGEFTFTAELFNILGGVFFLLAAYWFLQSYLSEGNPDLPLFASMCLLFCMASILFPHSKLWDASWWFWHLLRLFAYFIVLWYAFILVQRNLEELRKLNRAWKTLNECNQVVVRAEDEAELLAQMCRTLVQKGGYRMAWVGFAQDDPAKSVRPVAYAGFEEGYLETLAITYADTERGRGPTGTAIRTGKPAIARNIRSDPQFAPWREEALKRGYASSIALPLTAKGKPFGSLNIYANEPDAFDDEEINLLTNLADNLAYGITTLRIRADRDRTLNEVLLLQEITASVVAAHDFSAVLAATLSAVCEKTDWPYGEAWLPSADGRTLRFACASHSNTPNLARFKEVSMGFEFAPGEGLPGRVWASKEPIWVRDITTDKEFLRARYARESGLTSAVAFPVLADSEVIAIFDFLLYEAKEKDQRVVGLISSVASQLGLFFKHKRAEDALRESEEKFRTIIESSPSAIILLNREKRILLVNAWVEKLFGYTREELLGKEIQMLVPERFRKVHARHMEEYFARPRVRPMGVGLELMARRKDGSDVPVDISLAPVETREGTTVMCSITDLTERKEAEARWLGIFENAIFGIYQSTPDGRFIAANTALARILGYESANDLITNVTDIAAQVYVNPEDRERYRRFVESYGFLSGFEIPLRRKDGTVVYVSVTGRVVRDPSGKVLYYEGFVEDLTAKKQLEAQVSQSQKMGVIGSLAGGIAHDFNNMLQAIMGLTELAMEKLPPEHPAREDLQRVFDSGVRAAELTRKILTFGRKQIVAVQPVDINEAVHDLLRFIRSLLGERITLNLALANESLIVMMDPVQLDQVLMNLCTNAAQAMPEGGTLEIRTQFVDVGPEIGPAFPWVMPGRFAELTVTDTGVGMNRETLSRIFEPFFTTKPEGTGLGLAVVYGIVKHSGGFITVDSEPGKGATFRIFLPRAPASITGVSSVPLVDDRRAEAPAAILVVEDDETVRGTLEVSLRHVGYTVLTADNGESALRILEEGAQPVDLVLADVVLPGMSTKELIERIHRLRSVPKVILMSGYAPDSGAIAQLLSTYSLAFIQKPFQIAELTRKVREILSP